MNQPPLNTPVRHGEPLPSPLKTYFDGLHKAIFGPAPSVHQILSGTTAQRPVDGVSVGSVYTDLTLNKLIQVKSLGPPIVWMDAMGAVV